MKIISNYDGCITIPSKMNDLTKEEVIKLFPDRNDIVIYPPGIEYKPVLSKFKVRKQHGGSQQHVGYFKTFLEAIIGLENYCTKHKLKLF